MVCFGIFILQGNSILINEILKPLFQRWVVHSWLQSTVTEIIKDKTTAENKMNWKNVSIY